MRVWCGRQTTQLSGGFQFPSSACGRAKKSGGSPHNRKAPAALNCDGPSDSRTRYGVSAWALPAANLWRYAPIGPASQLRCNRAFIRRLKQEWASTVLIHMA